MPDKRRVTEVGMYPVFTGYRVVGYYDKCNLDNEELVVVARGVGGTGDVKLSPGACFLTNLSIAIIVDETVALKKFLYYYFKINNLRYLDSGSAQSQITISDLKNVKLPVPPLETQKKIVTIMELLDSKIALNQKINENLERQVAAVFDRWFVDPIATDSKLPVDWIEGTLGDVANIASGKRPPMRQASPDPGVTIPLVGAASIMGYTNQALYSEPILVTGRVGTHGIVQRFQTPCWASDNTLVIKSPYYEFVYQILQRIDYKNMNRGSTQPLITQTDLKNSHIVLPTVEWLQKFETLAGGLMAKYETNRIENGYLAKLREDLLPKLMSGEIDVSGIQL